VLIVMGIAGPAGRKINAVPPFDPFSTFAGTYETPATGTCAVLGQRFTKTVDRPANPHLPGAV
jgi:hypothetical protein